MATAGQFATTLQLAGCRHARNILLGGAFEFDSNADGLGDAWAIEAAGTTGTVTTAIAALDPLISQPTVQQIICSGLGTTSGDRVSLDQTVPIYLPGSAYTLTVKASVLASAACELRLQVQWYAAGGAFIATEVMTTTPAINTWVQPTLATTAPTNAATAVVRLMVQARASGVGAATVQWDGVQFEPGATVGDWPGTATLLAGDWVGLTGGQLVRVVADATANDAGAMTVEVRHMLRAAVSSGTAVTLEKPTALYVRTEAGLALPRMPGNVDPGLSLDLVEVFA